MYYSTPVFSDCKAGEAQKQTFYNLRLYMLLQIMYTTIKYKMWRRVLL